MEFSRAFVVVTKANNAKAHFFMLKRALPLSKTAVDRDKRED